MQKKKEQPGSSRGTRTGKNNFLTSRAKRRVCPPTIVQFWVESVRVEKMHAKINLHKMGTSKTLPGKRRHTGPQGGGGQLGVGGG